MTLAPAATHNSTNVRSYLFRGVLRAVFAVLNRVPPVAVLLAEALFFTPPRRSRRAAGTGAPASSSEGRDAGRGLAVWRQGRGPVVALVHGWGGSGHQLAAFVPALLARGFSTVSFDAPGHGRSDGRRSSMPEFAAALGRVAEEAGPLAGIVAHSLGAGATALAMSRGLAARRVVFLGPPQTPVEWTERMARVLGISRRVMDRFRSRAEGRLGLRWEELHVPSLARGQTASLLVLHDRDDREVPWSDGLAVATSWPGARLLSTAGLGHRRILREPAVVEAAAAFVAGDPVRLEGPRWLAPCATPDCQRPGAGPAGTLCASCSLERDLFVRSLRLRAAGAA